MATCAALPYGLTDLPLLIMLPALLVSSGFFSGSETALFSLSAADRTWLSRRGMIGGLLDTLLLDTQMLLITLMFGNMLTNVLYFVISSALALKLDPQTHAGWILPAAIAPLLLIIVFGEVLPKMVANLAPTTWVRVTVAPLYAVHRLIWPLRVVLQGGLIAPLGRLIAPSTLPAALSADELRALVEVSEDRGVIDRSEERLLREVVRLSELKVRDVMVPRVHMRAAPIDVTAGQLLRLIRDEGVTKIPVYRGDLDHIEGVIYAKQALLARTTAKQFDPGRLVRRVRFVPEIQRVDQLLEEFRKGGTALAIAVDEYGGTAGLVTLKDVVERMVGDLDVERHEGGAAPARPEALGPGRWRVPGELPIADWVAIFGRENIPGRVATVGGLVTSLLGRIPRENDQAQLGNVRLEVSEMDGQRVGWVELSVEPPEHAEAGGEGAT